MRSSNGVPVSQGEPNACMCFDHSKHKAQPTVCWKGTADTRTPQPHTVGGCACWWAILCGSRSNVYLCTCCVRCGVSAEVSSCNEITWGWARLGCHCCHKRRHMMRLFAAYCTGHRASQAGKILVNTPTKMRAAAKLCQLYAKTIYYLSALPL